MFKLKSKLIIAIPPLFGLLVLILSCEKEIEEAPELSLSEKVALNEENALVHHFANVLAKSLSNKDGRSFIKKEALKEFDGDYDILFAKVKDEDFSGKSLKSSRQKTYGSFLKDFYESKSKNKSNEDFDIFINSLSDNYPLLQISIPEVYEQSTENWDISDYTPLVAVLPDNFDENITEVITAYDMDGNISYLNINEYPDNPVIIISQNERLLVYQKDQNNSKSKKYDIQDPCTELYYETQSYQYYMPIDCGGGSGGSGGESDTSDYDRDNNNSRDKLSKARFQSKDAFRQVEPWP